MNAKEMNPLERHVEKIVLALAAAGALYMGYLAIQPVLITDNGQVIEDAGKTIPADEVEKRLADPNAEPPSYIQKLLQSEADNSEKQFTVRVPDYKVTYRDLIQKQPLPPALYKGVAVASTAPPMGPGSIMPTGTPETLEGPTYAVVTPQPVAPIAGAFKLELFQRPVALAMPTTADAAAPAPVAVMPEGATTGPSIDTRDQNAVAVQGYIPVGEMVLEMARQTVKEKTRLPDSLQRAEIYRIHVWRRERTNNEWSQTWTEINPTKAAPQPPKVDWAAIPPSSQGALITKINEIAAQFPSIVMPNFYLDDKGVIIMPSNVGAAGASAAGATAGGMGAPAPGPTTATAVVRPKAVVDVENQILKDMKGLPPSAPGVGLPRFDPNGAPTDEGGVAAPTASTLSPEMQALKNSLVVPFCFWDETVIPGHEYQYKVQVEFVNPTYNWSNGLKDKSMSIPPTLAKDPVVITMSIRVPPDLIMFLSSIGTGRKANDVSFLIFKQTSGKWYQNYIDTSIGMGISGTKKLPNEEKYVEIDAGLTIVDIDRSNPDDPQVVLMDSTGQMSTRDLKADTSDPQRNDLISRSEKLIPTSRPATTRSGPATTRSAP